MVRDPEQGPEGSVDVPNPLLNWSVHRWVRVVAGDLRVVHLWGVGGTCGVNRHFDGSIYHPRLEVGYVSGLPSHTFVDITSCRSLREGGSELHKSLL